MDRLKSDGMEILLTILRLLAAAGSIGLALIGALARLWFPLMLIAGAVGITGGSGSGYDEAPWDYIRSR